MIKKFLKDEKAQGAIEYILLAGGIIVAAVVIFAIYASLTKTAGGRLNESANLATLKMQEAINNATKNITG